MPAKQASGRVSSSANQMSPPSFLLNSLNELNGTTQRFSTPSHRVQCLLFTLRMLVVPESGSIRSSCLKSTGLPFASIFAARFLVASSGAFRRRQQSALEVRADEWVGSGAGIC
ncbi:hypothetical protein ABIB66_001250 [Bradyrhizobium sp. F1.13.3]